MQGQRTAAHFACDRHPQSQGLRQVAFQRGGIRVARLTKAGSPWRCAALDELFGDTDIESPSDDFSRESCRVLRGQQCPGMAGAEFTFLEPPPDNLG